MKNNNKFIPPIYENDVILPLFTKELRDYLKKKLFEQSKTAHEKMVKDGWGKTKFGNPNRELYGDYTHRFINRFNKYLNMKTFEVYKGQEFNGNLYMICKNIDIKNKEFEILPLLSYEDPYAFDYFLGFKFKLDNYGKDFYKISTRH